MEGYLEVCTPTGLLPEKEEDIRILTESLTLEKALYEIGYELGSRPDWVGIPLRGLLDLLPSISGTDTKI